jgi:hypothetical protein
MRRTLISAPTRDTLIHTLPDLGTQQELAAAFADHGLPDPVADDGRVLRSQKAKLVSRYFDAID